MRNDSVWSLLTAAQRETLEGWLFDENLGYAETLARAQQEFGVAASLASVGRYYRFRARQRQVIEMAKAESDAEMVNAMPVTADSLRTAAVKLVGKAALALALTQPDQVEALAALTRLLLESEDIAIRRRRLVLEERYSYFEEAAAARREIPEVRAFVAAIADDASMDRAEKLSRIRAFVFGGVEAATAGSVPPPSQGGN